ncbi:MAG: TIM barrel protein [Candidatus Lokiarchaeota archaeon]|nr:TIM barrel protein [Candidatus Lokiarchaeota archaeon]
MKIGCFSVLFSDKSLKEALKIIKDIGCEMVELGTGNYPGNAHCNPEILLNNSNAFEEFKETIKNSGLELSALSCHGNPVHPNSKIAEEHQKVHRQTVELASKLGIDTVVGFSGCPGANKEATVPSWNIIAWPPDYLESLKWQWEEVLIPFWSKESKFAEDHNVKIAFELHPGFCVYNTETMLKLREATGKNIGANFDPSHLFWQNMDPLKMVRKLSDCIFHVHAKDCKIDPSNTALNGCNDATPYGDEIHRSWIFRTVGYGHDVSWWKNFVSELRLIEYDKVLSIEHEDSLMAMDEGLTKAFTCLKEAVISRKPGDLYWA